LGVIVFPLDVILDYNMLSLATVLSVSMLGLVLAHKWEALRGI